MMTINLTIQDGRVLFQVMLEILIDFEHIFHLVLL